MAKGPSITTWVATALVCVGVAWGSWGAWERCGGESVRNAADAVPLYLPGLALREGADPTDRVVLERLRVREAPAGVQAEVLSTLYPPSMAPPMALLVGSGWEVFLLRWRAIVLTGFVIGCAAAGWGGARGRRAPLAAAIGALAGVTLFPLTAHALALGQANLLIVGLLGAATWAAARDRAGLAATFASLGVAVKLVPGIALWPLLAARRWKALAVAAAVGLTVAAVTVARIPAAHVFTNLVDTVRFQQGVTPAWMSLFPGPILPFLGVFRFSPLGAITVVGIGICAHVTRESPQRPAVLAAGIALASAWLGAAASAVGVFYGLLLLPAIVRLAVWPLAEKAPRWTWGLAVVPLLPRLFVVAEDNTMLASFQMFVVGLGVWALAAVQLLHAAWPRLARTQLVAIAGTVILAVGFSVVMVATAPAFPTDGPSGARVPVGVQGPPPPGSPAGPPRVQ